MQKILKLIFLLQIWLSKLENLESGRPWFGYERTSKIFDREKKKIIKIIEKQKKSIKSSIIGNGKNSKTTNFSIWEVGESFSAPDVKCHRDAINFGTQNSDKNLRHIVNKTFSAVKCQKGIYEIRPVRKYLLGWH